MNRHRRGFTLIMALIVLALLSGLGAVMTMPALRESKVVRHHQARLQAEYLALAGIEYARGLVDRQQAVDAGEHVYQLGDGEVTVKIEPLDNNQYQVTSMAVAQTGRGVGLATWTLERRITAR